jgi:hypothetical protein
MLLKPNAMLEQGIASLELIKIQGKVFRLRGKTFPLKEMHSGEGVVFTPVPFTVYEVYIISTLRGN